MPRLIDTMEIAKNKKGKLVIRLEVENHEKVMVFGMDGKVKDSFRVVWNGLEE